MAAGSVGPRHIIDSEQVWTLVAGRAGVRGDAGEIVATVGGTFVIPADAERTVTALEECEFLVCGSPSALATALGSDSAPVWPPWVL